MKRLAKFGAGASSVPPRGALRDRAARPGHPERLQRADAEHPRRLPPDQRRHPAHRRHRRRGRAALHAARRRPGRPHQPGAHRARSAPSSAPRSPSASASAQTVSWWPTIMLVGISMGQAVIFPTHNSLLADYYPVPARPRIYSAHRSGISIGAIIGVLLGAGLAAIWSWRAPFFFFAVPIAHRGGRRPAPPRATAGPPRAGRAGRADARLRAGRAGSPGRRPRAEPVAGPRRRHPRRAATVARARRGARSGRSACCAASSSPCPSSPPPSPASPPWPRCSTRRRSTSTPCTAPT